MYLQGPTKLTVLDTFTFRNEKFSILLLRLDSEQVTSLPAIFGLEQHQLQMAVYINFNAFGFLVIQNVNSPSCGSVATPADDAKSRLLQLIARNRASTVCKTSDDNFIHTLASRDLDISTAEVTSTLGKAVRYDCNFALMYFLGARLAK